MQTRTKIKADAPAPVASDVPLQATLSDVPAAAISVYTIPTTTTNTKEKKLVKGKKKSKTSNDPITILLQSFLEESSRFNDIVDFLDFDNIRSLSCTNKRILNDISTLPAIDIIWKSLLYSVVIDERREYQINIAKERREIIEKHFGCRKIALAVKSNTCSSCGLFTANIDLVTCSRACLECWMCKDSGNRGTDGKGIFALCALSYAKTHYLLSDSDISKNLLVLDVNDPDKSHGLLQDNIKVLSDNQAKTISIKKFGGQEGLNQEKSERAAKSEKKWLEKCNKAKAEGKPQPAMPDQVRKEKEKLNPQHTNFICVNQRYGNLVHNSSRYGYYKGVYGTNHLTNISPLILPTFIITDATDEKLESMYEGYSISRYAPPLPVTSSSASSTVSVPTVESKNVDNATAATNSLDQKDVAMDRDYSATVDTNSKDMVMDTAANKCTSIASSGVTATAQPKLVVYTNLVDAVCSLYGSTKDLAKIIIDKICNIPQMISSCNDDKKKYVVLVGGSVGDTLQKSTLRLYKSIIMVGTSKSRIISNTAAFWTSPGRHCQFKNLNIRISSESYFMAGISLVLLVILALIILTQVTIVRA